MQTAIHIIEIITGVFHPRLDLSKTIMTIVPENETPPLAEGIEDVMGDLDTHSGAVLFTLDISFVKGSIEAI